jgi:hypothetical protein
MDREYRRKVEAFVTTGAALIGASIPARYGDGVAWNPDRPLEPGFIPPDHEAKVTIISWKPNDGDLRGAAVDYRALRDNFARWGRDATVEAYRVAYDDWVASLPAIPFYRTHTRDVLGGLGLRPHDIAWVPLVKLPMRPKVHPSEDVLRLDRDNTWKQIHLLMPGVVWIQGIGTTEKWIGTQVREQITERVAVQNINDRRTKAEAEDITAELVRKLKWCLAE